jgi:phosphatidylserine decarboxylase
MMNLLCRLKRSIWTPLHPKGWPVVGGLAVLTILLWAVSCTLGIIFLVLTLGSLYMFRNPARQVPEGSGFIVSPADGVIAQISEDPLPEAVAGLDVVDTQAQTFTKVSISVDCADVQVTRVPLAGEVQREYYHPGSWGAINTEKNTKPLERSIIVLKHAQEGVLAVSQVADLVKGRVVSQLYEGDSVETGEIYGTLRCGGWVEVYLPKGYSVPLTVGSRVTAGETMIGLKEGAFDSSGLAWRQV